MSQLTPWYPPHIKPVRAGVYNASIFKDEEMLRYWDGKNWSWAWTIGASKKCIKFAIEKTGYGGNFYWRGLSAAPTPEKP